MHMKKIISICAALALSCSLFAQLAWDTEFTKDDFNNAQTVISKSVNSLSLAMRTMTSVLLHFHKQVCQRKSISHGMVAQVER